MVYRNFAAVVVLTLASIGLLVADDEKRLRRALDWPQFDLRSYERLFVEDCRVTDPKASERKIQDLVTTAPKRMADYIAYTVDREFFPEVERRSPGTGESGLILRVELTQYKPGSQTARSLLAGAGSAHLDMTVRLIDASTGKELGSFSETRNFSWGGIYGGSRGITLMEEKAATELAAYLSLSKGVDEATVLARLMMADDPGPPEAEHGSIYVMRPQGFVGAAARFRVGVNDVTVGESKRKTYHLIYAPPGQHQLWWGYDKKQKFTPITVEAGKSYYFMAIGMKEIPPQKGEKKLKECKLIRSVDITGN